MESDTLVVHQGALGDLMITLSALHQVFPRNRIDIFCRQRFIPLVVHLGAAAKAFNVEGIEFSGLYAEKPDEKLRSRFTPYRQILLFSNSPVLIKNITSLAGCPVYGLRPRPEPEISRHVADHLVEQMLAALPEMRNNRFDRARDGRKCKNPFPEKILIHPGSGSIRKNWPLTNYIRLSQRLRENGIEVEWSIGPAEKGLLKSFAAWKIPKIHINVDDLVSFCSRLTPSVGFIGNDSGLTHLAAYLGVPVIAIFGPSDPVRWRPLGPDVTVVGPVTDCLPCFETKPSNCVESACLKSISVEKILEHVRLGKGH